MTAGRHFDGRAGVVDDVEIAPAVKDRTCRSHCLARRDLHDFAGVIADEDAGNAHWRIVARVHVDQRVAARPGHWQRCSRHSPVPRRCRPCPGRSTSPALDQTRPDRASVAGGTSATVHPSPPVQTTSPISSMLGGPKLACASGVFGAVIVHAERAVREVLVPTEDIVAIGAEDGGVGVTLIGLADDRLDQGIGAVGDEDRVCRIADIQGDKAQVPVGYNGRGHAVDVVHPDIVVENAARRPGFQLVEDSRLAGSSRAHRSARAAGAIAGW